MIDRFQDQERRRVQKPGDRAVVIGAGMGGLAAAIRLRAAGLSVTVVEMAEGPGGKARAVPTPAGPADTGPPVVTRLAWIEELFALCGTRLDDHVQAHRLPLLARHFWPDGSRLDLTPDTHANADAIANLCGAEAAAAFRRFDAAAAGLLAAFEAPVMLAPRPRPGQVALAALRRPALIPGRSLQSWLRGQFRDPRLVQLFGRYATYVGGWPAASPAVLALIWRVEAEGVHALTGGLHGLAQALARVAQDAGVRFRYATRARRIVRQGGAVSGVEIEGGATLPCDICVFNGDPAALREGLLGPAAQAALPARAPARPSLSAWVWAFAGTATGLDLDHHNVFFTEEPRAEFGPIARGQMPEAPTLYVCAQDRGLPAAPAPGAPERFEIILNGPAGHPAQPGEEETCRQRTFQRLARFGLTLTPPPPGTGLTTPAMLAARFPGSQGAIYGASPEGTFAAFSRPRARTGLAGLYLA
ncbi:MAG: FAD-dependent oxidoreductase, partial [Rhodobacterales bacterium]|nr:FAD-dependent oxidoreductase [Rhodobacterales bacterium]